MDTNTTREEKAKMTIAEICEEGIAARAQPEFYMLALLADISLSLAIIADKMKG